MIETLVLATHNKGKVAEFEEMLGDLIGTKVGVIKCAADFDLPEPEETESTFAGNALLKARAAAKATNLPCLADDSGLAVDSLNGAPGIYSARWAETPNGRNFQIAMRRVHDECHGIDGSQTAQFIAVLALMMPDGTQKIFEGVAKGHLTWPARGDRGFGYDPIFIPEGHTKTYAEIDPKEKHAMSHRANAILKFKNYLNDTIG